jgi:5'-nucleotidase
LDCPLILVTNDDGIDSVGLWAAVEALLPLGEVIVATPERRRSGLRYSLPFKTAGRARFASREINGKPVVTYAVNASPAMVVAHGVTMLAPRRPALVVSGISLGANVGAEAHVSGSVGAVLEAGTFGIPAMTVSLEVCPAYRLGDGETADYSAAMAFTQGFARRLLTGALPHGVNALNINVPSNATTCTRWQITRLSRRRHSRVRLPDQGKDKGRLGYALPDGVNQAEPYSDIWALETVRVVSVTPLAPDLAAAHLGMAEDFTTLAA